MLWLAPIVLLLAASSTCNAGMNGRKMLEDYFPPAYSTGHVADSSTVDLQSAEEYTVLASSRVTNTPTLNKRASTTAAAIAQEDLADAYNNASSRVENVVNIDVVNIGGLTFTPGLYKSTDSFEVSSGTLYLRGNGVYIFQMEKMFTMSTGLQIILQDDARASDIFWVVGTSATFEASTVAAGTFMAHQSISVKTGASITGRLLALNAAVTMQSNTVVYPTSDSRRRQLGEESYAERSPYSTGTSTVGGRIGVSPGSEITGETDIKYFAEPTPNERASTDDAATAKVDVTTAFNDAASRVEKVVNIDVVNIGGLTFTPGLYKSTGALEVSSGTLYLRGNGVFIFQMEETFTVSTGLKMVLEDGAQARNVFWKVGSAALFQVGSEVVGTFMAHTAIDALTGASIEGRLFSLNVAVNLQANDVAYPSLPKA
eukprot:gene523-biopygen254